MTSEAARLREHLRRVGEVKAISHREAVDAHLKLPLGERLVRGVRLSDAMLRLHREAALGTNTERPRDLEAETWQRVNDHLQSLARRERPRDG